MLFLGLILHYLRLVALEARLIARQNLIVLFRLAAVNFIRIDLLNLFHLFFLVFNNVVLLWLDYLRRQNCRILCNCQLSPCFALFGWLHTSTHKIGVTWRANLRQISDLLLRLLKIEIGNLFWMHWRYIGNRHRHQALAFCEILVLELLGRLGLVMRLMLLRHPSRHGLVLSLLEHSKYIALRHLEGHRTRTGTCTRIWWLIGIVLGHLLHRIYELFNSRRHACLHLISVLLWHLARQSNWLGFLNRTD
jgi:hypothetical protein